MDQPNPVVTRNLGEWYELWAVLKILAEGRIDTLRVSGGAVRESGASVMVESMRLARDGLHDYVLVRSEDGRPVRLDLKDAETQRLLGSLPHEDVREDFLRFDGNLRDAALDKKARKGTHTPGEPAKGIAVEGATELMRKYLFGSGKSASKLKQDCELVLLAPDGLPEERRGFSIKSYRGSKPTLFNASGATYFRYRINGEAVAKAKEELPKYSKATMKSWVVGRTARLDELHSFSSEVRADHGVFTKNLRLLHSEMECVIGHLLRYGIASPDKTVKSALERLILSDPLGWGEGLARAFYTSQVKRFLRTVALGMTAASPWDGDEDAEGGMLLVTKEGRLFCLLAGKSEFEQYLLETTFFDTPATGRMPEIGMLSADAEGVYWYRLSLQIRENDPIKTN